MKNKKLRKIANTIRTLSIDAIEKAKSGHPGLPLGMADVAAVLFAEFMNFNPDDPQWINRDRFVLSGGHGSMLLYSVLHLFGYDVTLDDIKEFRQLCSKTPGHPEYGLTPGVETTTGPLGQGLGNAVGMAIGEAHLSALVNKKKNRFAPVIDHYTYVFAGDGDMEEGISHEVCSLAGHLKLNKLIVFYDYNNITIDGELSLSSSDDVQKRFEAYGWQVLSMDGHDYKDIKRVIALARESEDKPVLIITRTIIGYGSPHKAGTSAVHGSPLGEEEVLLTKEALNMPLEEFYVLPEVYEYTAEAVAKKKAYYEEWKENFERFAAGGGKKYKLLTKMLNKEYDESIFDLNGFEFGSEVATRAASLQVLERIFDHVPSLLGGSADLTPSNKTKPSMAEDFTATNRKGRYIHYGIREHGMAAIMNGLALYGGIIPYGGTFAVFSDYLRPALRMAALMKIQSVFVFTHDSIGLGEDGPTHQPVEHLTALRVIPGNIVFRPMDAAETVVGWQLALESKNNPFCLMLSRQKLPVYLRKRGAFANAIKARNGAYVLTQDTNFRVILMASGSEVSIAVEAKKLLNGRGYKVRVVSMPSMELFEKQDDTYKNLIFPAKVKIRIAIEAGHPASWYKYIGESGKIIGISSFGASAPYQQLYKKFNLTADHVVRIATELLEKR